MKNDLTKGSVIKQILLFSIPYLIGNLFQQFYNIADMIIVGRALDSQAYAAVGATGSIVWFSIGAIQALTVGFSMVLATFCGARDEENVKKSFGAAMRLSLIISLVFSFVLAIFAKEILLLMQTPSDIINRAYSYLLWLFIGLIATAAFNLLSNAIRALGNSRTPLYFLVFSCIVNIILDVVFIAVLGMDTDGAGLATAIAQLLSAILCAIYIIRREPMLHVSLRHLQPDASIDKKLFSLGLPMAFLNMVLSLGAVAIQFVTNGLGTAYVTAQTTAEKIINFTMQPFLSIGSATSVFAAQNNGAKSYGRVRDSGKNALILCFIWLAVGVIVIAFFGDFIVRALAGDVDSFIIDNAYKYIIVATPTMVLLAPLIIYKSILQAIGRNVFSMISGFTEIGARVALSIPVIFLIGSATLDLDAGFTFICFANPFAWLIGMLTVLPDYVIMKKKYRRLSLDLPHIP